MRSKSFLFTLFIFFILVSCSSKQPLLKKWKLDHIDASGLLADIPEEMKDTLQVLIDRESAYQKGKMTFDFKEKGKVIINSPDLQGSWEKITGTWILNEESKLLIIQIKDKKDEYILHKLTEEELILELIDRRAPSSVSGMVNGKKQGTKVKSVFK